MADIVPPDRRSRMMASIKASDTLPERIVRSHLHRAGLRFRLQDPSLPGRPDVVLRRWRVVIFVNGCFWHSHPQCPRSTTPSSNRTFWRQKLGRTVQRDRRNNATLRRMGWRVFTVWECATSPRTLDAVVRKIRK